MKKILFIDSGLGGATIIKDFCLKYSGYSIVYLVLNSLAPLGEKSKEQMQDVCLKLIDKIALKEDIALVVLACNTLTSACAKHLREVLPYEVVGVEPNVKVRQGKTLVLATTYTIKNCLILKDKPFIKVSLPALSCLIDKKYPNVKSLKGYLRRKLKKYKDVENIIFGCTHYYLVKEQLQNLFPAAKFYNSAEGVSKRIEYFAKQFKEQEQLCSVEIILTKKDRKLMSNIINYLK